MKHRKKYPKKNPKKNPKDRRPRGGPLAASSSQIPATKLAQQNTAGAPAAQTNSKTKFSRIRTRVGAVLTAVATLASLLFFYPRPVVTATDPVDPRNAMSASFTVVNNGFIPLENVTVSIELGSVSTIPNPDVETLEKREFGGTLITKPEWTKNTLAMDDAITISPGEFWKFPGEPQVTHAIFNVVVTYQPWYFPFSREKTFRFRTQQQSNGNLYWYRAPIRRRVTSP